MSAEKKIPKKKPRIKKIMKVPEGRGIIHIKFSFNNTILRLTKENGDALGETISAGNIDLGNGKKVTNTKKGTVFMAEKVAEEAIKKAVEFGIRDIIEIRTKGIAPGRDFAVKKLLGEKSLNIKSLGDATPIPHGGCRPRKAPRK